MDDIKCLVGKRVRALRKERGLTQEGLGWRAELHYTYIGAVERGEKNCSIETLDKISKALSINIYDLFTVSSSEELSRASIDVTESDLQQKRDKLVKEISRASIDVTESNLQQKRDKLVKEISKYSPEILKHFLALIKSCQRQKP